MSSSTNTTISSTVNKNNRLVEIKKKLSLQVKNILEKNKLQADQLLKQNSMKPKVYTNLYEVQCMKDVKSQNGFFHEYQIGKKLGEGCHSSIYKCIRKKQNKTFAVKVTKQKDLEIFQSIREGYRILKKLSHQNIIQAINLFINQKYMTCFMVIQYCQWEDLRSYLLKNNKIQKKQISTILTELLKTITYMHNSGVCHRDIKPENILYDPTKGKIKILDFDFSRIKKFTNSKLEMMTKTGQMSYRAPEIFNSIYDQKVDVWAVGIIAYELITSKYPFYSQFQQRLIQKICQQQPDYSDLSIWQQDLLQKLLCKDPINRSTAAQALSSLFFLVNSKTIQGPSISKTILRSPSAGKQQFQKAFKQNFASKFYDDEVTNMFLGDNQGDIGVIRFIGKDQDHNWN